MYYAHIVNNFVNIITKNKKEAYEHDRDYTTYNWGKSEVIKGQKNIRNATGLTIKDIREF